jgi:hypothetical protein
MNQNGKPEVLDIKVISTKVSTTCDKTGDENEILFSENSLLIPCDGSTWLEVLAPFSTTMIFCSFSSWRYPILLSFVHIRFWSFSYLERR